MKQEIKSAPTLVGSMAGELVAAAYAVEADPATFAATVLSMIGKPAPRGNRSPEERMAVAAHRLAGLVADAARTSGMKPIDLATAALAEIKRRAGKPGANAALARVHLRAVAKHWGLSARDVERHATRVAGRR